MGLLDGFLSLGDKINKWNAKDTNENQEGVVSAFLPELDIDMDDEKIIKLTQKWESSWIDSDVRNTWLKRAEENRNYWLGKQFGSSEIEQMRPLIDNKIFEALETFLPEATKRNPEAKVELFSDVEKTPENVSFADGMEKRLNDLADELKLRLKIKKVTRQWAISLLGVAKVGWDMVRDDVTVKPVRVEKLILDPNANIDEDGYNGEFVGEYMSKKASILVRLAPDKAEIISELVKDDMGTEVQFIAWSTKEYTCWTLGKEVLLKKKNPNWNYGTEAGVKNSVDDYGGDIKVPIEAKEGLNHFKEPKIPYIFLSVFNLGKQPIDDTSLIGQNLSIQDLINKRLKQIDRNADSMNGGIVVSEERSGLTKDNAKGVTDALRKGGTIVIPAGAPNEAIQRFDTKGLPADIFNQLADSRSELGAIFGTRGLSASTPSKTARELIAHRQQDSDRVAGGVTEYLEQFADDVYNWFVQLTFVYKPEFQNIQAPPILVSVTEGSMLPRDSITEANQAITLFEAGALDPITLFEKLEYPNPKEAAKKLWLWQTAPQMLFQDDPEVQQLMQQQQAAAAAQAQQTQQGKEADMQNKQQGDMQKQKFQHDSKMAQIEAKSNLSQVPLS